MGKFILAKKIGMTTLFGDKGADNVTLVECGSVVSGTKVKEKDGYAAVQLKIEKTKKKSTKREFRISETDLKKDDILDAKIFEIGEKVRVSGIAKAKGFQGGVKRHGFKGAPKTHGHKHDLRAPGSIGSGFPEHVVKGKRMAGRMGGKRVTTKSAKIVYIDTEKNILGIKGPVPGIPGTIVEIVSM